MSQVNTRNKILTVVLCLCIAGVLLYPQAPALQAAGPPSPPLPRAGGNTKASTRRGQPFSYSVSTVRQAPPNRPRAEDVGTMPPSEAMVVSDLTGSAPMEPALQNVPVPAAAAGVAGRRAVYRHPPEYLLPALQLVTTENYTDVAARPGLRTQENPQLAPHELKHYLAAVEVERRCRPRSSPCVPQDFLDRSCATESSPESPATVSSRPGGDGRPLPNATWIALPRCEWGASRRNIPQVNKYVLKLVTRSVRYQCERPAQRDRCTCWRHSSTPPALLTSREWARPLLGCDRPALFIGHSHQRRMYFTFVLLLQDMFEYVYQIGETTTYVAVPDPLQPGKYRVCVAAVHIPSPAPALDTLKELMDVVTKSATDGWWDANINKVPFPRGDKVSRIDTPDWTTCECIVVIGRGMWDMLVHDYGPEHLRKTHAIALATAAAFFKKSVIIPYVTHHVHQVSGGCTSLERQVQYRDAVFCAVDSVNEFLDSEQSTLRQLEAFDVFDMTATRWIDQDSLRVLGRKQQPPMWQRDQEDTLPGVMPIGDGHHFDSPLLINIALQLLQRAARQFGTSSASAGSTSVNVAPTAGTAPQAALVELRRPGGWAERAFEHVSGVSESPLLGLPRPEPYCGPCRTCTITRAPSWHLHLWCEELKLRTWAASSTNDAFLWTNVSARPLALHMFVRLDGAEKRGALPEWAFSTHGLLTADELTKAFPPDPQTLCPPMPEGDSGV